MRAVSAEHFVLDQIPLVEQTKFVPFLKSAYATVNTVVKDEPILLVETARINRGHLIAWSVDTVVERALKKKQLPYDYKWASFARPTGRYLKIRLPDATMSIHQVSRASIAPRTAKFRSNVILRNAPFLPIKEIEEEAKICGLPHFYLVHGYHELSFAHIGVPDARKQSRYLYRTPNLMNLPHAIIPTGEVPPVEDTDEQDIVELKIQLDKWRKENDDE